jgi:hypothetical protein
MLLTVVFSVRSYVGRTLLVCRETRHDGCGATIEQQVEFPNHASLRSKLVDASIPSDFMEVSKGEKMNVTTDQLKALGFIGATESIASDLPLPYDAAQRPNPHH